MRGLGLSGSFPPRPGAGRLSPAAPRGEPRLSSDLDVSASLLGVGVPGFVICRGTSQDSAHTAKGHVGEVRGRQARVSRAPPRGVTRDALNSPVGAVMCVMCHLPPGTHQRSAPMVFIRAWPRERPPPGPYPIPGPLGEQVFGRSHSIAQFMPTEALLSPGWEPPNLRSQTPAEGPRCEQARGRPCGARGANSPLPRLQPCGAWGPETVWVQGSHPSGSPSPG